MTWHASATRPAATTSRRFDRSWTDSWPARFPRAASATSRRWRPRPGSPRTGFYPKKNRDGSPRPGPYQHLAEEFERRLAELREQGVVPNPRAAQVERLKEQVAGLKERLAARDAQIDGLADFRQRVLSQLAAQRMEIERLREALATPSNVRALPNRPRPDAPYGSCS
jgi:hypothetical protein